MTLTPRCKLRSAFCRHAQIRNVNEYWNWTRSGLVNGIRAGPYYNDLPPFLLRGYVNDKVSKILGYATMRQLRIKPSEFQTQSVVMPQSTLQALVYGIFPPNTAVTDNAIGLEELQANGQFFVGDQTEVRL